jgi:hypothetical protein
MLVIALNRPQPVRPSLPSRIRQPQGQLPYLPIPHEWLDYCPIALCAAMKLMRTMGATLYFSLQGEHFVPRIRSVPALVPLLAAMLPFAVPTASWAGTFIARSTFNTSANGWTSDTMSGSTVMSTNGGVAFQATGGNLGGYLAFDDTNSGSGTSYVIAPSKFLGDYNTLAPASGGVQLMFDHKIFQGGNKDPIDATQVRITGADGLTAVWTGTPPATTKFKVGNTTFQQSDWVTSTVDFDYSSQWHVDGVGSAGQAAAFVEILNDVTDLKIRIELVDNNGFAPGDLEGIDNVLLRPVPEPGSLALAGVGLCGVGANAWRRWRKRRAAGD